MPPAVHQFHQGIQRLSAVGEEMLVLRSLLRREGYASEIIVGEEPPAELRGEVIRLPDYEGDASSLLLVHHSMGHPFAEIVGSLPDARVVVYHNVTPPRFFRESPGMRRELERGRRQLDYYRGVSRGAISNSRYSATELRARGFFDVEILPPCVGRLAPVAASERHRGDSAAPLVLFVGRAAWNKRQLDLVAAFEAFVDRFAPAARLVLCGELPPDAPYSRMLTERVAASPCARQISLRGLVTDRELADLRAQATLYVSMSEHEGFGVPLLEAFAAGLPVLAFRSSAVAEAMGGGGILFSRKDPGEVAALMAEVAFDEDFRRRAVEGQFQRLREPDLADAEGHFLRLVKRWIPNGGREGAPPLHPRPAAKARLAPWPHVAAVGPFDGENLEDQLLARILERELQSRLPGLSLVPHAFRREPEPIALDGGFSAQGLEALLPDEGAPSEPPFDCVVVCGEGLSPADAERIREVWPADALFLDRVDPDLLLLASRLFPPDLLRRRIGFLRLVGGFPPAGRPLVIQGGRALACSEEIIAAQVHRVGSNHDGIVLMAAEPAKGDREFLSSLAARLPGPVTVVPECAGVADLLAVLAHAGCFLGSSRGAALAAASFGVPTLPIASGGNSKPLEERLEERLEARLDACLDAWLDILAAAVGELARVRESRLLPHLAPFRRTYGQLLRSFQCGSRGVH